LSVYHTALVVVFQVVQAMMDYPFQLKGSADLAFGFWAIPMEES